MSDVPAPRISALARAGPPPAAYLDGLNPEQRRAVEAIEGPVLVLAFAALVLAHRPSHPSVYGPPAGAPPTH